MMIILVTADNYLLMFVGWEGDLVICPKWLSISDHSVLSFMFIVHTCNQKRFFFSRKLKSVSYLSDERRGYGMRRYITKKLDNLEKITPYFVTGFVDAECCFMISILRRAEKKTGWHVKPEFKITLHSKDLHLLEKIQSYFGVGRIIQKDKRVSFEVKSLKDISGVIISHFDLYPLITQKFADFILFKSAVESISRKEHLTEEGIIRIVGIRSTLNLGLTPVLKEAFPKVIPVNRPLVKLFEIIDPNWLAGFISGEGCFYISISKDVTRRTGFSVNSWFILGQHSRDKKLIEKLKDYLSCGNIRIEKSMVLLRVSKFSDIADKIIPFRDKHPVQGIKYLDYLDFKRVVELIISKAHITPEGLAKIRNIKEKMNTGRDFIEFLPEGSLIEGLTIEPKPSSALLSNLPGKQRNTLGGITQKRSFGSNRLKPHQRIGPHDLDVISLIVGSLLSNSYLEKREYGLGIRIIFVKWSNNVEYLMWFHSALVNAGYCSFKRPRLYKLISKGNKVFFLIIFKTYSFSSFRWLYDLFYPPFNRDGVRNNLKIFPEQNFFNLLTPLVLATIFISSRWAEDKAINIVHARFKGSFPVVELKQLVNISHGLKFKYNIETEIKNNCGHILGRTLLIKNYSKVVFTELIKAHILPSQHYLLNSPNLKLTFGTLCTKRGF